MLPLLSYKQSISLVILLLVTSPSSTQSPSSSYICPSDCECKLEDFSARCENLETLISSYNRKFAGRNLMPIKSLDLSNSDLTKISSQLEVLVNLTELNLSHNKLSQVRKLNFQHLETLDLSHNHITSGKLSKLPRNIINLNLAHNDITYLPIDFMKLKKLRTLDLHENPLNCTCETLHVRNWMSYQNVWSSKVVKCSSPQIVKGQPWLQARQNDICFEPSTTTQRSNVHDKWDDFDGNDIMMGDQPQDGNEDNNDGEVKDVEYEDETDDKKKEINYDDDEGQNIFDEDKDMQKDEQKVDETNDYDDDVDKRNELDNDFMIVDSHHHETTSVEPEHFMEPSPADEVSEGSGSDVAPSEPDLIIQSKNEQEEEEDDGSGSGGGLPIVDPTEHSSSESSSEQKVSTENPPLDESDENDDETTVPSIKSPGSKKHNLTMGIFEDITDTPNVLTGVQKSPIEKEKPNVESVPEVAPNEKENLKTAEDNTGTYILLAIIGILLVSLIVFIAMKNRQEKRQARRRYDVEKNGATELQDMDKTLLGKPLEKNGNGKHAERSPLMNDYSDQKDDRPNDFTPFKAPEITVDEPIQELPHKENEKSQQSLYDIPNGNGIMSNTTHEPIEPVHSSPNNGSVLKSPDSDEELFHPASDTPIDPQSLNVSPEPPKRYSPVYPPVSPRSARYSPVYSPETGRVKIKLTETPKPKTPVVVTRSRSRAGDYINIPNN